MMNGILQSQPYHQRHGRLERTYFARSTCCILSESIGIDGLCTPEPSMITVSKPKSLGHAGIVVPCLSFAFEDRKQLLLHHAKTNHWPKMGWTILVIVRFLSWGWGLQWLTDPRMSNWNWYWALWAISDNWLDMRSRVLILIDHGR